MTNDYKNEIRNLIKVITNLEDTIQASCEIFV